MDDNNNPDQATVDFDGVRYTTAPYPTYMPEGWEPSSYLSTSCGPTTKEVTMHTVSIEDFNALPGSTLDLLRSEHTQDLWLRKKAELQGGLAIIAISPSLMEVQA